MSLLQVKPAEPAAIPVLPMPIVPMDRFVWRRVAKMGVPKPLTAVRMKSVMLHPDVVYLTLNAVAMWIVERMRFVRSRARVERAVESMMTVSQVNVVIWSRTHANGMSSAMTMTNVQRANDVE